MPSPEPAAAADDGAGLDAPAKRRLLETAWASIRQGLAQGGPLRPPLEGLPAALTRPAATFVTLERGGELRGCIGRLEASRPLIVDVAANAYAAAFEDPRFPPLTAAELEGLGLSISVLTPPEPLQVRDEADLLARLRPGVDGLILEDRGRRGTFLPSVWQSLPEPAQFLAGLRRKAGLPPGHWSDSLVLSRYRTLAFGDREGAGPAQSA